MDLAVVVHFVVYVVDLEEPAEEDVPFRSQPSRQSQFHDEVDLASLDDPLLAPVEMLLEVPQRLRLLLERYS